VQHFVEDQTNRPKIGLIRVLLFLEKLRRHVERRPHNRFQKRVLALQTLCKAEIANFALVPLQQYVRRLQIAVDDVIAVEILDSPQDLFKEIEGFLFT
jgi:hypothetical protein